MEKGRPLRRQSDDHHIGSLGAGRNGWRFHFDGLDATKHFFVFLQESPLKASCKSRSKANVICRRDRFVAPLQDLRATVRVAMRAGAKGEEIGVNRWVRVESQTRFLGT